VEKSDQEHVICEFKPFVKVIALNPEAVSTDTVDPRMKKERQRGTESFDILRNLQARSVFVPSVIHLSRDTRQPHHIRGPSKPGPLAPMLY